MSMWRAIYLGVTVALTPMVKAQMGNFSLLPRTVIMPLETSLLRASGHAPVDLLQMPTPWSYTQLAVFCKLDVQMERRLRMPVLFRLGDVQRVEAMEGKGPLREAW